MFRALAFAAALLPTVCGGSSTSVQFIDLTDASPAPSGMGWLGATCDPSGPETCEATMGLLCAAVHTPGPQDVYGTCVYPCGTTLEAAQCQAWDAGCTGAEAGAGQPAFGYCVLGASGDAGANADADADL